MTDNDWLAERFESDRAQLRAVASRMLGPGPEADDVVQDAWLRLSRSGAEGVDNLTGWLTTVVARLCLDVLRSRRARPDEPFGDEWHEATARRRPRSRARTRAAPGRFAGAGIARCPRQPFSRREAGLRAARRVRRPVRRDRRHDRALSDGGTPAGQPGPPPGAGR